MRQIRFQCLSCFKWTQNDHHLLFPGRIKIYIGNGWDISRLTDPNGSISEELARKDLDEESLYVLNLIENPPSKDDNNWTQNLENIPSKLITHSVVEKYFKNSGENRHVREGYTFSKTLKFETSGRPMRVNLTDERYFLLEGYTRPSMKTSKGIAKGEGIYRCLVIFSL